MSNLSNSQRLATTMLIFRCGLMLLVLLSGGTLWAQPEDESGEDGPETSEETTRDDEPQPISVPLPKTVSQDLIYLPNQNGELIPVPLNVTVEDYLDWLDRQDTKSPDEQLWVLRDLNASGSLTTDATGKTWANVDFRLEFAVDRSGGWNSIPLYMGEALLSEFREVRGSREEETEQGGRLMVARDSDSGQWLLWYRNLESFRIELEMLAPVQTSGSDSRLQLTLPPASRTNFELQTSLENPSVDLNGEEGFADVLGNESGSGSTIRVAAFQQSLDLSWSDASIDMSVKPIFDVESQIQVLRQGDETSITARQMLNVERGAVESLDVRLPSGFQVDRDELSSDREISLSVDSADPSAVTLKFQSPVQSSIQIDWKLSAPVRRFNNELLIDGFDVEGARKQTGKVAVKKSNDWRMTQVEAQSDNIIATDVREIPFAEKVAQGYRFYNQPFQLVMTAQRSQTTFSAASYFDMIVDRNQLTLSGELVVTPRNGIVEAVSLIWDDFEADGWELSTPMSEEVPLEVTFEQADQLVIGTPGWNTPHTIRFSAIRKLNRPIEEYLENEESLEFSLPEFVSVSTNADFQDQILRVSSAIPEIEALPVESQGTTPSLEKRDLLAEKYDVYRSSGLPVYNTNWSSLQESEQKRELVFQPVHQEATCKEVTVLSSLDSQEDVLTIDSLYQFEIERVPTEQFRFRMTLEGSDRDAPALNFFDSQGEELEVEVETRTEETETGGETTQVDYLHQPSRPQMGRYSIHVRRQLSLDRSEDATKRLLNLPRVDPSPCDNLRRELVNRTPYQLQPGKGWRLESSKQEGTRYLTFSPPARMEFRFDLTRSRQGVDVGYVDTVVESNIGPKGEVLSEMQFLIRRTPASVNFTMPPGAELLHAYWSPDGSTERAFLEPVANGAARQLLLPDAAIGQPGRLTVATHHASAKGFTSLFAQQLQLPGHSLQQRIGQMTWNLSLPHGVYLLQPPENLVPHYQWSWRGFGFRRTPLTVTRDKGLKATGIDRTAESGLYRFVSYQWPEQMRFRSIGRTLLMTMGCGIPLLLAVILLGRGLLFQVRGLLVTALAAGIFWLMLPDVMSVLAQPILIGLLAITVAVFGAHFVRSRQDDPTLIIVGPHDQNADDSEGARQMNAMGVDPDDVTRLQPPRKEVLGSSHSR